MTTIVTLLTQGYADWETALLNAVARQYYEIDTLFATPGGRPVVSAGGLRVTPDLAIADIDAGAVDALVLNGGTAWTAADAPELGDLPRAVRAAGGLVAAICDGTLALARAGLLDQVRHTGNGPDALTATGYAGAALYQQAPAAVSDGRVVTAPGTAPVSFMAAVMAGLGRQDDNLAFYLGLHAAEHRAA